MSDEADKYLHIDPGGLGGAATLEEVRDRMRAPPATPEAVLGHIRAMDPAAIAGKNVYLCCGITDPAQIGIVAHQIEALKAAGAAHIALLGPGESTPSLADLSARLHEIAHTTGCAFMAGTDPAAMAAHRERQKRLAELDAAPADPTRAH